ncbi:xaa-Pro aminopeptidase ApepP-like [Leptopilina boulardi]|uniref:xaa-Pro aminopeptidase ApepP-like n=1 Tax=Leptopilina boulardi TaxID=63433 RepID=UPI0021F5D0E0|nr:xaa-Pro aminopeptidase ApepP-like [Leptopilina boulardi]
MVNQTGISKLARLRELMKITTINGVEKKGIQAFILNYGDSHQSEYLTDRDKRLSFLSGFTGSRGTIIVTNEKALLWTDGRYFLQAINEFDPPQDWTLMKEGVLGTPNQFEWLNLNLPPKSTVGVDINVISYTDWVSMYNNLNNKGHVLIPLEENLVDKIWDDRPIPVLNSIVPHKLEYSGKKAKDKIENCQKLMKENGVSFLVISALDEVAYLLNWRGSDIPYNPVFFAYIVLESENIHIFLDKTRLTKEAEEQLKNEGIIPIYHSYESILNFLKENSIATDENRVWISSGSSSALHCACGSHVYRAYSPIGLMKSIKNETEIEGMKAAHIRDGVALVKYFAWLEDEITNKNNKTITEISGAEQLEKFRQEQELYVGVSFTTISSSGDHAAIIHYHPTSASDKLITDKEVYLCDAGAQFLDGTTDTTRTWHFGTPTDYERECFTRVFKGQCFLNMAIFPNMIKGNYLDTLARKSLWDVGLDYIHGTGHGVGSYLNVHEFPIGISWKPMPDDPGVQAGVFLSNEPGFYEDGKFGIRLENIELVVKANSKYNFNNRNYLTFETVTLVPIQTSFLDLSLLTDAEIDYINKYHAKCLEILKPLLQGSENTQALSWLIKQTKPISK